MALTIRLETLGPFGTHAYLLTCDVTRDCEVVDVGFEAARIGALLASLGLAPRYLLNTHAHYDHLAAMRTLQQAVGGEWWMHPDDRFLADALTTQGEMFDLPPAQAPEAM